LTPTPSNTPTPSPSPTPTFPRDALPKEESVNLRAGPHLRHPAVGLARAETPLAVRGRTDSGDWLAVYDPAGSEGWVNAELVNLLRSLDTIPTRPTPSPPPPPTATAPPMDPALPVVLAPPAVAQGDPLLVRARLPGAQSATAGLGEVTSPLVAVAPDTWAGLLPVPVGGAVGAREVVVTGAAEGAEPSVQVLPLTVAPAGFREETIILDEERLSLLNSPARAAENARLAELLAPVTPERLWQGAWQRPVDGTVSSGFGTARQYSGSSAGGIHTGVDFRGPSGTPVRAAAAGRVVLAEKLEARGNTVWLDHGWGVYSGYFHMSSLGVRPGDLVGAGQTLGAVGATGMVTGPHLHWEVRLHGVPVQPLQWLLRDYGAVP
jgi:murein DD-endopeptidase MepM/ murein hydrolase activator NlpD